MTREGYEILEHTADVGIRAWGPSLAEALARGGEGLADVLGARSDGPGDPRRFHVEAPDAGVLAVGFLNELLYLHESEEAAFGPIQVVAATETEVDAQVELVPLAGEPEGVAVKAATYHRLAVERDADRVTLTVYLDV